VQIRSGFSLRTVTLALALLCATEPAISCAVARVPHLALITLLDSLPPANNKSVGDVYSTVTGKSITYMDPRLLEAIVGGGCGPLHPLEALSDQMAQGAAQREIILLGEIHDNHWHHGFRATMVKLLEEKRYRHERDPMSDRRNGFRPPPVAFEQLTTEQTTAINSFVPSSDPATLTDDFLKAVDWASSGWAQYDYRPLFDAALAARMPIYAGDVPKSIIRQAAKQGEAAIAPEERARLKLDVPLPANQQDAILTELEASHCGMMPKTAFGGMAFAQRLRDATLADVALKAHAAHGSAIVMAGNGHVRGDRGIAWYIRQREPNIKVVTVALVEVEDGKTDPAAYVPRDPEGKPAVDYVVFTPKHVRPDPCAAFVKPQ
jgi:uncharacterized iron-regulated protein